MEQNKPFIATESDGSQWVTIEDYNKLNNILSAVSKRGIDILETDKEIQDSLYKKTEQLRETINDIKTDLKEYSKTKHSKICKQIIDKIEAMDD